MLHLGLVLILISRRYQKMGGEFIWATAALVSLLQTEEHVAL